MKGVLIIFCLLIVGLQVQQHEIDELWISEKVTGYIEEGRTELNLQEF